MTRICMISDDFAPAATGVGVTVQLLSRELCQRGLQVDVVTVDHPEARSPAEGVGVHRTRCRKVGDFWVSTASKRDVARLFDELSPELVHLHYPGMLGWRCLAEARRRGLPVVATAHVSPEILMGSTPMLRPVGPVLRRGLVHAYNRCGHITVPSMQLGQELSRSGVTRPVHYVSNPIALPPVEAPGPSVGDGGATVLYAGRLHPEKCVDVLVRAMAQLRGLPARLWIAGEGFERERLDVLVDHLGLRRRVSFLGFLSRSELARCYRQADLFVLPSRHETQGMVALEAMACGTPVIVGDRLVSAADLVGEDGVTFAQGDPTDLADKMASVLGDPALQRTMVAAGLRRVEAVTPQRVAERFELVYRQAGVPLGARDEAPPMALAAVNGP